MVSMHQLRRVRWVKHIPRQETSQRGENPQTRNTALVTVHAHEIEIRGRNSAARSLSERVLLSSQDSVPDFELLRFRNKEPGEQTEDDAAVVDFVEELLHVEEPERIVVETHVEIVTSGNALESTARLWCLYSLPDWQ